MFLHGHADLRERDLMDRADLSAGPASVLAVRHALELAGIGADDLATIDLYSCFPGAGVQHLRRRSALTPTIRAASPSPAGCRSSAAPGNNYSMHAIAETVQRARRAPGSYGLVGANGGIMSKYSAGVYSTTPAAVDAGPQRRPASRDRRLARAGAGPLRRRPGHHRDLHRQARAATAPAPASSSAAWTPTDAASWPRATTTRTSSTCSRRQEPIGQPVYVRSFGPGNRVTTHQGADGRAVPAL